MASSASLPEFLIAALLVLAGAITAATAADADVAGAAPPLRVPRLGAPPTPAPRLPPRLGRPIPVPPIIETPPGWRAPVVPAPWSPPELAKPIPAPPLVPPRVRAPAPAPRPPPQLGKPLPAPPVVPPRVRGPAPAPAPRLPPRLGKPLPAPPVVPPRVRAPAPAPAPRLPPRLGKPLPAPPVVPPRVRAPAPAPGSPPQLGKPLPTPPIVPPRIRAPAPAPRLPPRLGKPTAPAPAPRPPPRLGDPLPTPGPQAGAPPPLSPPPVASGGPKVPALIAFGDSIVDTGNNNHLLTMVRANFPPYGKDFPDHRPTGRFCDGKITVDFLASALGLKEFLPPYLHHNLTMEDLKTGVSFASAASGYNNNTCLTSSALTMEKQLQLFREYKVKVGTVPERALYLVVSGSNDIVQHFTWADGLTEPEYADIMAQRAITFVESLIAEGARQIGVSGAPPVGCIPSQRRIAGGLRTQCATDRNQLALMFNRKLSVELSRLAGRNRGVNLFFVDMYSILADLVQRYEALGFTNGKDACCGFIGLAAGPLCNIASRLCPDPAKYVFWDSYHPSERAYKLMIDDFMTRYTRYIH